MAINDWITGSDLARLWDVSPQRIDQFRREGRLKSRLLYGRRLYRRDIRRPAAIPPGRKPSTV